MSATIEKPQRTSIHVPRKLQKRLAEARRKNRELEAEGKLPPLTKPWSKESLESLTKALGGK